jgi:hypothetical protein
VRSTCRRLHIGTLWHLTAQQPGQHFDTGERILDLVRHDRGHLANGRQPVAQPLPLFDLFDVREVLEKQRSADDLAGIVAHQ